jgi:RNA 2',3'-cyclic 3'-phosphodiesterase
MSSNQPIRCFVCIEISESVKLRIQAIQRELGRLGGDVSWVKPSNIHLTLKFMGDVPAERISLVTEVCSRITQSLSPFIVTVGGTGCFPSRRNPKVLWVGLRNVPEELRMVQCSLEDELQKKGFKREDKPFSPHLTLGRIRGSRQSEHIADALLAWEFAGEPVHANELILMRSELHPAGAHYTPLGKFPFGQASQVGQDRC